MKDKLIYVLAILVFLQVGTDVYEFYRQRANRPEVVREAPMGTTVDVDGRPWRGDSTQRLVLVEFSDFECPFCIRHATGVAADLHSQFVATGVLRHAFVNNPLEIHRNARLLAAAGVCANNQGGFWEMHEAIFARRSNNRGDVVESALELGLTVREFEECLERTETKDRVQTDVDVATELGLTQTPAFALGTMDGDGLVSIEFFIMGAQPLEVFQEAISELSERAGTG